MNFEEHASKPLLAAAGISIPPSRLVSTPEQAAQAAAELGPLVVKAQVPTGKRGKAGGIKPANDTQTARSVAARIIGMQIGSYKVEKVLLEQQANIVEEYYAAVLNDTTSKGPLLMFSPQGGMDIEEVATNTPDQLRQLPIDIRAGLDKVRVLSMLDGLEFKASGEAVTEVLLKLYDAYRQNDAELLEINPLALLNSGELVALDCKFVMDDSAIKRQPEISLLGTPDRLTELEAYGQQHGLKYIDLDGDIGVVANGAGLTMTTMDVITYHGGKPANFLEIGGDAYTKAEPALQLVLDNPKIKSLVVNFCGAFARTDVMTDGVINAWQALQPSVPIFFCVHGTGAAEARTMLKARLGVDSYDTMDQAIVAAIDVAAGATT